MRMHVSINVKNVAKSVEFYRMVFGVEPQKRTSTYAKFDLKEPYFNFSMHESSDSRLTSQVNHLGLEVMSEQEVTQWQKKLEALRIAVTPEENTDCCYARQDKVWFSDPDGNSWEVFFVHEQLPVTGAEPPRKATNTSQACGPGTGCC